MTVTSNESRVQYYGDGSLVNFAVPFRFLDESHLDVYLTNIGDGVETLQTITTDYTVAVNGDNTGTVTFVSAPSTSVFVTIIRNTPVDQLTDFIENDPFPAEFTEDGLDKLTMICQELVDAIARGTSVVITDPNTPTSGIPPHYTNVFVGLLGSPTNGVYPFTEVEPIAGGAGTWQTRPGGLTGTAMAVNLCTEIDYSGLNVVITAYRDSDGIVIYRFDPPESCP